MIPGIFSYLINIKKIKPDMVAQTVIKANSEAEGGGSELHDLPWQLTQYHKVKKRARLNTLTSI